MDLTGWLNTCLWCLSVFHFYFIVCAYSSVWRCRCCAGAHVCKGERQLLELLISAAHLVLKTNFLRHSLSMTWNLPSSIGYIVSEPQLSACFCLPNSRIINVGHHDGLWMGVDGLNPRSSRLHGLTSFSKGAISPGPLYALFTINICSAQWNL